jgi:hypothetical protein
MPPQVHAERVTGRCAVVLEEELALEQVLERRGNLGATQLFNG